MNIFLEKSLGIDSFCPPNKSDDFNYYSPDTSYSNLIELFDWNSNRAVLYHIMELILPSDIVLKILQHFEKIVCDLFQKYYDDNLEQMTQVINNVKSLIENKCELTFSFSIPFKENMHNDPELSYCQRGCNQCHKVITHTITGIQLFHFMCLIDPHSDILMHNSSNLYEERIKKCKIENKENEEKFKINMEKDLKRIKFEQNNGTFKILENNQEFKIIIVNGKVTKKYPMCKLNDKCTKVYVNTCSFLHTKDKIPFKNMS